MPLPGMVRLDGNLPTWADEDRFLLDFFGGLLGVFTSHGFLPLEEGHEVLVDGAVAELER